VRLYGPGLELAFSTALQGVVPFELARVTPGRLIVVGRADAGRAPVRLAMQSEPTGGADGCLAVSDVEPPAAENAPDEGLRGER
jgi:hypothetical protein